MAIRTRLTLWYTGLLAVSLVVLGVLLYSAVAGILLSLLDDRLTNQAEAVVSLIAAENDPLSVMASGRAKLPSIDVFDPLYYIQILQLDGRAVQLSENLRGQRLPLPADVTQNLSAGEAPLSHHPARARCPSARHQRADLADESTHRRGASGDQPGRPG